MTVNGLELITAQAHSLRKVAAIVTKLSAKGPWKMFGLYVLKRTARGVVPRTHRIGETMDDAWIMSSNSRMIFL